MGVPVLRVIVFLSRYWGPLFRETTIYGSIQGYAGTMEWKVETIASFRVYGPWGSKILEPSYCLRSGGPQIDFSIRLACF